MTLLFTAIGIIVGGMLFHFAGALSGGIIGFLSAYLHDLRQRQEAVEKELARLARRLGELTKEAKRENFAPAYSEKMPDEVVRVQADMPVDDETLSFTFIAAEPAKEERIWRRPQDMPVKPEQPSPLEKWLSSLFNGENLLVKMGVVILFFGVSFLLKYAAQHGLFPLELRLAAAALGGCALLAIGWQLRDDRPVYAQVLQGGGSGILYLTVYATMHLYQLIPVGFGFALLVAICALSAILAVAQDSRSLALMGSAGGFLAPQLAGIASSSPAMLLGYYAILNGGILAIALRRAWRELNLLGFVGTFIVSALWGSQFYRPEHFFSVEPFLVLFFLVYATLPVLYARQEPTLLDGYIDCTLVFGTPIVVFALQSALMRTFEYGMAWSALGVAGFYITLAARMFRSEPGRLRSLVEAFLALGTVFGTLTIPLAFDGRWTSAAWSIEGAALVWVGLRQQRNLARAFGYLLLIGSGVVFLAHGGLTSGVWPVLNGSYIGSLLVSGAALFSAFMISRNEETLSSYEGLAEPALFAWGIMWWYVSGLCEVGAHTSSDLTFGASLSFVVISCLAYNFLRPRLDWHLLEWPAIGLLPAMICFALLQAFAGSRYPSLHGGWFGWPLALAAWYFILHGNRQRQPQLPILVHITPWWLISVLAAWELHGRIAAHLPGMETWALCAWGAVPALMVLLISRRGAILPWPIKDNLSIYTGAGSAPLAMAAWLWLLFANLTQAGNPWPLPYLPLINPLDGTSLLVLVSLIGCYRAIHRTVPELSQWLPQRESGMVLAGTGFIWLNTILLRSVHHWCGVPFTAHALFASLTVQATLSICWCLLALTVMTFATRRGLRPAWLAGAALLGAVLIKLFLVDLSGHGSVARIVSFIVVGIVMLLIGWLSPVPPREAGGVS
ncbi:DUF2339 domain-containing protein [Pelotalea chapellei]|uniref:DUF2339 domain-containing protein n=1 Tax=Pelotalea chapellei TaxID=44671 RepID=A0ABS5UAQ8_9BACT|nr:DUF2339 domain-containing protein [Pelotalea chapellei]MBT1072744.1 DUF2339 domain-containing protein [Pelotalea chapellei]